MADDTRSKILTASGPIFAEKGYEAATVREICDAAGVNLCSVNYHFGDKAGLYLETVQLAHTQMLEDVPPPKWPDDATPQDKLSAFIRTILTRMLSGDKLSWRTRLLTREMLEPTIACQPLVEDYIRPQLNVLLGVLEEVAPNQLQEHQRYKIAFSIIGQCLHYRVAREFVSLLVPSRQRNKHYTIPQLAEHITQFSWAAIQSYVNHV